MPGKYPHRLLDLCTYCVSGVTSKNKIHCVAVFFSSKERLCLASPVTPEARPTFRAIYLQLQGRLTLHSFLSGNS